MMKTSLALVSISGIRFVGVSVLFIGTIVTSTVVAALWVTHQSSQKWLIGNTHAYWSERWGSQIKTHAMGKWLIRIGNWHSERWQKCGFSKEEAQSRTRKWLCLVVGISLLIGLANFPKLGTGIMGGALLELLFLSMTRIQMRARQAEFATGVYKIYRYMALQLTAGMSATETVKHLHEAVTQPSLKDAMYSFSSCYFRTMNVALATEELTKRISGDEIQVLAAVLRQGIETGDHYGLIQKQEQLMLKRYYAALETETELIHAKGVGIAIGLCLLVFILLAVPLLYEMGRASQMIFN
jgi:hypothetical protein